MARISHAEIKAGVFLTFCLALFVAMLFVLGKFGHAWRGRQEVRVLFTHISALRPDAPVRYNGMELGRVRHIKIVRAEPHLLEKLPPLARRDLNNLPLTEDEREKLRLLPDEGPGDTVDKRVRELIAGRTMVLLVLDMLSENDTRRFRADDEYRISGSVMGDNAVEVRTGCGRPLSAGYDNYLLGVGGDMYTDLGKSISQVKDILASMAEMVGGEEERRAIRGQLQNFEDYTTRIDKVAGAFEEKLPKTWDGMDGRMDEMGKTLEDVEGKLKEIQPKVDAAMESARKSIGETRGSFAKSADSLQEKIQAARKDSKESLASWRTQAAEYKEKFPAQLQSAREWTERFQPTVDKIDTALTRADDQLDKGIASTRATLAGYNVMASNFEETMYRLKRWPDSMADKPEAETAKLHDLQWRRDLARRQYVELRAELERARQELNPPDATDKARVARIGDLLRDSDAQLDAGAPPPVERPKKGKK
jgi:ABC-type transporter Mla subunit MlaD